MVVQIVDNIRVVILKAKSLNATLVACGKEFFQTFVSEAFDQASNCNYISYIMQHGSAMRSLTWR